MPVMPPAQEVSAAKKKKNSGPTKFGPGRRQKRERRFSFCLSASISRTEKKSSTVKDLCLEREEGGARPTRRAAPPLLHVLGRAGLPAQAEPVCVISTCLPVRPNDQASGLATSCYYDGQPNE